MIKPEDLNPKQRKAYGTWVSLGLTHDAAVAALQEDGLLPTTEHDQLTRTFRAVFGMSEGAARIAADGRGGLSVRPVSEIVGRPTAGPKSGDNDRLIRIIEAWAQDLRAHGQLCVERGETRELAALREAFYKVFSGAQNDVQALWVIRVVESRWPELLTRPSGSGNKGGIGRTSGTVRG